MRSTSIAKLLDLRVILMYDCDMGISKARIILSFNACSFCACIYAHALFEAPLFALNFLCLNMPRSHEKDLFVHDSRDSFQVVVFSSSSSFLLPSLDYDM